MDKTDRLRDYGLAFLLYEQGLGVCGYELIRELFIFVKLILNSYLQYKIGNWSVGAKYNYSGHNNYTVSNLPILRYNENKDWKPLQHMARLTATYTFSVGKSRRHDGKILIESSKDNTGLGKFNTPQISK